MESKNQLIILVLLLLSTISIGQNAQDTSRVESHQTPKGITTYEGLPFEEVPVPVQPKVVVKSDPQLPTSTSVKALEIEDDQAVEKMSTPIGKLEKILKDDIINIKKKLSAPNLKYKDERILRIKKEEAEYDLSFLKRIKNIKETIAYETTGNSESFIKTADRFLDTLFNEDTEVSERFKDLSQERYDNYLVKDKILKLRIDDVKVRQIKQLGSIDKVYQYTGFAILPNFGKRVRVVFFSNGFVRKADRKLMLEVAKEDNIEQTVIIEGVINEYYYGRTNIKNNTSTSPSISKITLNDWIIIDRDQLIQDFKKQ